MKGREGGLGLGLGIGFLWIVCVYGGTLGKVQTARRGLCVGAQRQGTVEGENLIVTESGDMSGDTGDLAIWCYLEVGGPGETLLDPP